MSTLPDAAATPPEPNDRLPSLPGRLLRVFVAPAELFAALRARPAWAGALVVGAALAVLSVAVLPVEIWEEMARRQIQASGRELPEGFEMGGQTARIFGVVGALLGWVIWTFVLAGGLTLVFRLLLGDEGRFRQYLAAVSHAGVVTAVGAVLTIPLRIARSDPTLSLSVGTFAVFLEDGYLYRVLSGLDLFSLWAYLVLALGVSRMDPRRGWGSAAALVLGAWVVFVALFALLPGPGV